MGEPKRPLQGRSAVPESKSTEFALLHKYTVRLFHPGMDASLMHTHAHTLTRIHTHARKHEPSAVTDAGACAGVVTIAGGGAGVVLGLV